LLGSLWNKVRNRAVYNCVGKTGRTSGVQLFVTCRADPQMTEMLGGGMDAQVGKS